MMNRKTSPNLLRVNQEPKKSPAVLAALETELRRAVGSALKEVAG